MCAEHFRTDAELQQLAADFDVTGSRRHGKAETMARLERLMADHHTRHTDAERHTEVP